MERRFQPETFACDLFQHPLLHKELLDRSALDTIAVAMQDWAISRGATHFTHWFQPLRGAPAEKHDTFFQWRGKEQVIESFTGAQLAQGEPDASSFPTGGLRSTFEARGYTGWDASQAPFLWREGGASILCIPSVFYSWTGEALDTRIPLMRAERRLQKSVLRLLELVGISTNSVYSTAGLEQEFFLLPSDKVYARTDLHLCGRTLCGRPSPKGQQLQDHYFGSMPKRVVALIQEVEDDAWKLGIPLQTRHNEVAPSQYEIAHVYQKSRWAVANNLLLMELLRKKAPKYGLTCLLHEKPFASLNGSGKHTNWSISTEEGKSLLDPTAYPENPWYFLTLLTAVLAAVDRHADLIRASVGSFANDLRLGGHEAPPPVVSVYVGKVIEEVIQRIVESGATEQKWEKSELDLRLGPVPPLPHDYTDRNRSAPIAFTGNKLEIRFVGASADVAVPVAFFNAVVADELDKLLDRIEQRGQGMEGIFPALAETLKESRRIIYSGNNYSAEWQEESQRRGLSCHVNSREAYEALSSPSTIEALRDVLSEKELASRKKILLNTYQHQEELERNILLDMVNTGVLPAAMRELLLLQPLQEKSAHLDSRYKRLLQLVDGLGEGKESSALVEVIDEIEGMVDAREWPWPKKRELVNAL